MQHDLKVGQKLWFVEAPLHNGMDPDNYEVEITQVGRKWFYFKPTPIAQYHYSAYRASIEDLVVDGGKYSSPGSCCLSEKEYLRKKAAKEAWHALWKSISGFNPPAGVTEEDILAARKLLKLEAK